MTKTRIVISMIFAISPLLICPLTQRNAVYPDGQAWLLLSEDLYPAALLFALVAGAFAIYQLLTSKARRDAIVTLVLIGLFITCFAFGMIGGDKIRMDGMRDFANRSVSLINAIKQYQTNHGAPPATLNDLTPRYLPTVPLTGMTAYSEYRYETGPATQARYPNNDWAIEVFTPRGFTNWDMIFYLPNQNYPATTFAAGIERIGDWGYLHE